jgi:large subunit ribosomal protein L15
VVTRETLVAAGLIRVAKGPAKILSNGELARAVTVRGIKMSDAVRKKIEAAGGRVEA